MRTSDVRLRFIWTLTAVALFFTVSWSRLGHRMMHGNFAWTGQTGVFLVYVESLLFLLTQPLRAWIRAAWVLFHVHVLCGVVLVRLRFPRRLGELGGLEAATTDSDGRKTEREKAQRTIADNRKACTTTTSSTSGRRALRCSAPR